MDDLVSTPEHPAPVDARHRFWHRILFSAHRRLWSVGILLVPLAVAAVVVNLQLPVLFFTVPGGEVPSSWHDLRDPDGLAYEQRLLVWPLASYTAVAVLGFLVAARAQVPPAWVRWVRLLAPPFLWVLALSGFLLALTGMRWLGFFLARQSETDMDLVRLGVVPYLNLAMGLLLVTAAAWGLGRLLRGDGSPVRWVVWSAVAAAAGLLLSPLLPFAHWSFGGGGVVRLDEFTLAAMGANGAPAAEALGWARLALWGALYASIASCLAWQIPPAHVPRPVTWLRHLAAVNVLFVVAGAVSLARFHERLPDLRPGVAADLNPFLHLALLALAVLWWFQVRSLVTTRRRAAQ